MARTFRVLILGQIGDVTCGPHYGSCGQTFGPSHESATKGELLKSIHQFTCNSFVVSASD